jgi:hypothetical protein
VDDTVSGLVVALHRRATGWRSTMIERLDSASVRRIRFETKVPADRLQQDMEQNFDGRNREMAWIRQGTPGRHDG